MSIEKINAMSAEDRQALIKMATPRLLDRYLTHVPHPTQQLFLLLNNEEALFGGAAGGGKAIALDTPLLTNRGWTTMGDVEAGEQLFDELGKPTTVVATSEVMHGHVCYEVQFSDGSTVVADAGHLWSVLNTNRMRPITLTTQDMAGDLTTPSGRRRYAIPVAKPIQHKKSQLLIDPYLFGYWLGDGDTRRGYITIGEADSGDVCRLLKETGAELTQLSDTHYRVEGLSDLLRREGVIGTYRHPVPKRIPDKYLQGSIAQRRDLLQGIVDSDGYVDDDVEITLVSKGLVEDVAALVRSLGMKVVIKESRAMLNGKDCGPRWRMKFMGALQTARLERKASRQKTVGFRGTHALRYIVAITKVPSVPVKCVQVDSPSHLYLAGSNLIPTHNSDALLMAALQYVDVPGYSALLLRRTWPDLNEPGAIMDRARTWLSDTDAQSREGGRKWVFPSGARLSFGYIQHPKDVYKFQSAEFSFIGWDELTHWQEQSYTYMFSRVRRPKVACENCNEALKRDGGEWVHANADNLCTYVVANRQALKQYPSAPDGTSIFDVPLRVRAASNPGGVGHQWVRERFIDPKTRLKHALFIPSRLTDNPSLDQDSYIKKPHASKSRRS